MSAVRRAAMSNYIKKLREMARVDKHYAKVEPDAYWREHHRKQRRHRLREAWHWRGLERTLRRIEEENTQTFSEAAE